MSTALQWAMSVDMYEHSYNFSAYVEASRTAF